MQEDLPEAIPPVIPMIFPISPSFDTEDKNEFLVHRAGISQ